MPNQLDTDFFEWASEMTRIGNAGVRRDQEKSRAAGVPPVYSINGILHWELPDGSLTTEDPWKGQKPLPTAARADHSAERICT